MKENKVDVIIISGAPGVGKSTAAKKLAEYFPKGVRLEVDTLRSMVISPDWKNQSEHISLLEVAAKLTVEFLALGFSPVIVIDTFSRNKIDKFLADLCRLKEESSIMPFALYCSEDALKQRVDFRSEYEFKDTEVCLKLNRIVLKQESSSTQRIDNTLLSPDETAELIYEKVK